MPARAPEVLDPQARHALKLLGERLRAQRKALRIAAASVAGAANMSRQTLHRIEQGEPSVTLGACVNALRALGLQLQVVSGGDTVEAAGGAVGISGNGGAGGAGGTQGAGGHALPAPHHAPGADTVRSADYPQLRQLAWHRHEGTLTGEEALALYERNWRHVDRTALTPAERELIAHLVKRHGKGALLV